MIKVFLVEDEIVMREGIKRNIAWEKEGFEFVGEASDGELAYPLIEKTHPDILITDIKMPFMDGLELSRLVRNEMPDTKIIILSGYDDFEYARESISIGVTDYLLKPISAANLLEAIKKVRKIILEEKEQKKYLEEYEKDRLEDGRIARQKFFESLVSGKLSVSNIWKAAREIELDLTAEKYNIILFQISFGENAAGYSEEINRLKGKIDEIADEMKEVLAFDHGIDGWAFLIKQISGSGIEKTEQEFQKKLLDVVKKEGNKVHYFGGIGKAVERMGELPACYKQAYQAFVLRYLKEENQIIRFEEGELRKNGNENISLSSLNVDKLNRRVVEKFLRTGLLGDIRIFTEEYLSSLGERNVQSLLFRQYIVMDVYFAAASVLEEMGYSSEILVELCGDIQSMAHEFSSVEKSRQYIIRLLRAVVDLRENQTRQKYTSMLRDAELYIEQHYADENISLNTVAASMNLSPNHFSTIFSQKTGRTFIEYLTFVRMEKAKELLRSTSMRTSEIAYEIGYKDSHYFSYIFKKTQECTPREFRARV